MLYQLHPYHQRTNGQASFYEANHIALVDAAHRWLGGGAGV
ncbi:hypothetical protein AB0M72_13670 [Nocardiopsis dassonvillei]